MLALDRLGLTLTRIGRATGVHRVTVEYLRAAGVRSAVGVGLAKIQRNREFPGEVMESQRSRVAAVAVFEQARQRTR
jgi:hypothetical protein